jgi:hypothetical protein
MGFQEKQAVTADQQFSNGVRAHCPGALLLAQHAAQWQQISFGEARLKVAAWGVHAVALLRCKQDWDAIDSRGP